MKTDEIVKELKRLDRENKRLFLSTSLQTHSIPLLHIVKESGVPCDYYFLQTGFHFPETLQFKKEIEDLLQIEIKDVSSSTPKVMQKDEDENFYFSSDPDYCCFLNKTQPMQPLLEVYDIWINGVRADQSKQRSAMSLYENTGKKAQRFHPILDWNSKQIYEYRQAHQLPEHPLDEKGYMSIGCEPCTRKMDPNDPRSARWFGMKKTECGLHTDLIKK